MSRERGEVWSRGFLLNPMSQATLFGCAERVREVSAVPSRDLHPQEHEPALEMTVQGLGQGPSMPHSIAAG